jgi:hypothetical protein
MSKIKGWCRCGGPLWRDDGFCRLCWLEAETHGPDRLDEYNSTDNAAATSQWLPRGSVSWVVAKELKDADRLDLWLMATKLPFWARVTHDPAS